MSWRYLHNASSPDADIWQEGVAPLHLQVHMQMDKILEVTLITPSPASRGANKCQFRKSHLVTFLIDIFENFFAHHVENCL